MKAAVITAAAVYLPRINAAGGHEVLLVQDPLAYPVKDQIVGHPALVHDPLAPDGLGRYVDTIFTEGLREVETYRPDWVLVSLPRDPRLCCVPIAVAQCLTAVTDFERVRFILDLETADAVEEKVLDAGFNRSHIVECSVPDAVSAVRKTIAAFLIEGNFENCARHLRVPELLLA